LYFDNIIIEIIHYILETVMHF